MSQFSLFYNYFHSFYGPNGLYPFNFEYSEFDISDAIALRGEEFFGDSVDREIIRDMILRKYDKISDADLAHQLFEGSAIRDALAGHFRIGDKS